METNKTVSSDNWLLTHAEIKIQSTADLSDAGINSTQALKLSRDIQLVLSKLGCPTGAGVTILASVNMASTIEFLIKADYMEGIARLEPTGVRFADATIQPSDIASDDQDINGHTPGEPNASTLKPVYTSLYFLDLRTGGVARLFGIKGNGSYKQEAD